MEVRRERLEEFVKNSTDTEAQRGDQSSELYRNYALESERGWRFYRSLTDDELLHVLKKRAKELGYPPAQHEVFWVWRTYLKKRFGKWPYVLRVAGLEKSAGKGAKTFLQKENEQYEYERLLAEVRKKAEELCRIPHPQELPELCKALKKYARRWDEVIRDTGLDERFFREKAVFQMKEFTPEMRRDLDAVRALAMELHRAPLKSELPVSVKERLISGCGSYRNALYQIGLEPVKTIKPFSATNLQNTAGGQRRRHGSNLQNCYYRIVDMDTQTKKDMQALDDLRNKTGKIPDRKQVDPEMRKRLQRSCGSWANVLYQLNDIRREGRL